MAKEEDNNEVAELIRKAENDYVNGITTIGKYVQFSQYENTEKITAYLNSKHTSGDVDSLGREKPFFNIGIAIRNIWYRATDIDRKDIRIKATKLAHRVMAFVASIHLQEWMKKANFGAFLNAWGLSLANYGSSVIKFVEKDGELVSTVIPWNRIISDTIDFDANPKIEILYFTPAQLQQNKTYDKELVDKLMDTLQARETTGRQNKDNRIEYIKLYELHGNLPLSYLTGKEEDEDIFQQQMHVVTFVANKDKGGFDDFTLYSGKESKDPCMITHLIPEDGRAQSIGAIESTFEAQWMSNHSQKLIKDQLDLTSRIIFQTSDGSFVGQNVLSNIQVGDILIHKQNEPLTNIANRPDITSLQAFGQQWQVLAKEISSTPDALRGENQPAGTAWRQVEALRQESHSLFEQMVENKSLDIERMMRIHVIPYLKKQMDTTKELAATLDSQGIREFDAMFVPAEAIRQDRKQVIDTILSNLGKPAEDMGGVAQNLDRNKLQSDIKGQLSSLGNQRYIKASDLDETTWKAALKDLEWEVEVDASGESTDKDAVITTLNTVLKTVASNPAILQDPNMKMLFNKILEETDAISPLELAQVPPPQPQEPVHQVSESISFKDLPPDGQVQMAGQAGIKINPPQPVAQGKTNGTSIQ